MVVNLNSGQVEIVSPFGRVYLYTHDHADKLISDVYAALKKGVRWDDPDYLAKMVFCHMLPLECWQDEKGFGIGTQLYTDINILVTLDTNRQVVTVTSAEDKNYHYSATFDSFVSGYSTEAEL